MCVCMYMYMYVLTLTNPSLFDVPSFAEHCVAHPGTGETFSCLCIEGYTGNFCEEYVGACMLNKPVHVAENVT